MYATVLLEPHVLFNHALKLLTGVFGDKGHFATLNLLHKRVGDLVIRPCDGAICVKGEGLSAHTPEVKAHDPTELFDRGHGQTPRQQVVRIEDDKERFYLAWLHHVLLSVQDQERGSSHDSRWVSGFAEFNVWPDQHDGTETLISTIDR